MKAIVPAVLLAVLLTPLVAAAAAGAPAQLYNKSVVINWSESIQEKNEAGQLLNTSLSRQRIAYVSSAGRIFVRSTQSTRSAEKKNELAPGAGGGTLAFQGNSLVGTAVFAGFARRITVNFDAGFSSCSASVVYGRAGGPQKWKSLDGKQTMEVQSISVSSASCAIRDGNLVAN
ncbi:hypothetical protein [Bradyrhizobium sp.]|uniref:hypothetical protein n=1 Tax=Bradyrhizobium sp. TaxID=376 RepID=UPI001D5E0559|nr:hypothetical protein [Bradyrhizobium sp.]MBI5320853.1 hypothetical protein [Bradyrhizobium sp.]